MDKRKAVPLKVTASGLWLYPVYNRRGRVVYVSIPGGNPAKRATRCRPASAQEAK
jgi:hypothetical protein